MFTVRAKPGQEQELADWAHRIVSAAREHDGSLAATVIGAEKSGEYRMFHHFRSAESLQSWLESSQRARLLAEAEPILESEPIARHETGLETWFRVPSDGPVTMPPPRWKMWITSIVAIYPLILAFQAWLAPRVLHWPLAIRSAVLPLLVLTLMTYVVMPAVTRVLRPWLISRRSR
jgi:antibiotic biosynthesis monooxygenase (ABM) superfamily enzyme